MGMTNEENFDGSLSRPGNSTGGDDSGNENEVIGNANVQVFCMRSTSRLFYKLSFKLCLFP